MNLQERKQLKKELSDTAKLVRLIKISRESLKGVRDKQAARVLHKSFIDMVMKEAKEKCLVHYRINKRSYVGLKHSYAVAKIGHTQNSSLTKYTKPSFKRK